MLKSSSDPSCRLLQGRRSVNHRYQTGAHVGENRHPEVCQTRWRENEEQSPEAWGDRDVLVQDYPGIGA